MQGRHWGIIVVVLLVGYALGIYFPSYGQKAVAAVSGS